MPTTPRPSREHRRRTRLIPIAAAAVALGAGVPLAVHVARGDDSAPVASSGPAASAPPSLSVPAPTGSPQPSAGTPQASGVGAAGAVGLASGPVAVRYTFDGGPSMPVTDVNGRSPLRIATAADGALNFASVPQPPSRAPGVVGGPHRAAGFAIQFPPRCTPETPACQRAILEGERDDTLNPGTRPLQYGASVLMSPADTADGANVMQKGYSVGGGSQFKLQVDHEAGRPSCVIAGRSRIYRVQPKIGVADSAWHTIVCTRSGSRLGITVDGVGRGSVYVPPALSIVNAEPLRVGGKGTNAGNDQFAGQIDNVFLTIS